MVQRAGGWERDNSFLSELSKCAELSYIHTNHCIGGTTATAMKRAGYTLNEIAFVLKHKNLESLKYYLEKPTPEDKTNFSHSLFDQTGQNKNPETDDSDNSYFETQPRPAKMPKIYQNATKPKPI